MLSNSTDRSRSRSLIVLGVLLAAVFACFWPLIKHPGWLLVGFQRGGVNDLSAWFLPRRAVPHFARSHCGELPFWCPWWGGGSPLLGNPQASIFYPLNWPLSVLNVAATISWSFVVHHLIAASGAYALCRKLGGTVIGSTFAAVAFGFSPVLLARTSEGHLATLSVASWFPWAFSMYQGFRKGSHRSAVALVGILALAIFAGHLQESYYPILTLTAVCACEALRYATAGQSVRALRLMGGWALIGIATAGLVAVELIPLTTYLNEAVQSARLRSREQGTPGLANLLQLLHPFALGDPAHYKGPGTHYWESICHFGLVALGLAVAGVVASIGERRPIGQLAGVGAGSFVLAFGHRVPVLGTLADYVPGLASIRCQGRWLLLTALPIAIFAGFGLDSVAAARDGLGIRQRKTGRKASLILAITLTAVTTLGVWGLIPGENPTPMHLPAVRLDTQEMLNHPFPWLAFGIALGCTTLAFYRPQKAVFLAIIIIPLGLLESSSFAKFILTTQSPEAFCNENPVIRYLADRARGWRIFCNQFVISDLQALEAGLFKVQAYEPLPLGRPLAWLAVMLNSKSPGAELIGYLPLDLRQTSDQLLNLWAVRYILLRQSDQPPGPSPTRGWRLISTIEIPSRANPA